MIQWTNAAVFVTALAMSLAAQQTATRIEPIPGPVALYLNEGRDGWRYVGRIVDAITGLPMIGAVLYQVPEREQPLSGEFWFSGKWSADADGFVRVVQKEAGRGWWVAEAPGYGAIAEMRMPPGDDLVTRLVPGVVWPVAVHDAFDQPVAGVEVGLCLGCGHTPDVRVAKTGPDGVALLRDAEPGLEVCDHAIRDLYPRRDGMDAEYLDSARWHIGDPPTRLRQAFKPPVSGRVLSPNGRPMSGVAVRGSTSFHRGPWAWTDGEGRFHLFSCPDEQLWLVCSDREHHARLGVGTGPMDLVLPPTALPEEQPTGHVVVTVRDADTGQPLSAATVEVWHTGVQSQSEAEAVSSKTGSKGEAAVDVVAGGLGVRVRPPSAGSGDLPTHDPAEQEARVAAGAEARVSLTLVPRPVIAVRVHEGVRSVALVTHDGSYTIDISNAEQRVPVPGRAPFAFRIDTDDCRGGRYLSFATPPKEMVDLVPFPPTRVRLCVVGPSGRPAPARIWLDDWHSAHAEEEEHGVATDSGGKAELTTTLEGCAFLKIRPLQHGLRTRIVRVALPWRGVDSQVDVGDVNLSAEEQPQLRVVRADGRPGKAQLTLLRPGLMVAAELAADGGWDGIEPHEGDRVTVRFDEDAAAAPESPIPFHIVPLGVRLAGAGPWLLREGGGALVFDVHDDFGFRPKECVVIWRDRSFSTDGRLDLRGLPDEDLELFVGAEDCDSARVRLHLAPGEKRTVDVVLRRRP